MKRGLDVFISLLVLVAFLPVMIIAAILVKWKLGSPVIFKQQRPGFHGKPFNLYKFRSMTRAGR